MISPSPGPRPSRRSLLAGAAAGAGLLALPAEALTQRASAGAPFLRKPLPPPWFHDYGSNAEMRWDSVSTQQYLMPQPRLYVRNHASTPTIDVSTYRLRIFGDGLASSRRTTTVATSSTPWSAPVTVL